MTLKIDVLGFRYDDAEPAFTELTGGFYLHLKTKKLFEKTSFDAMLTANSLAFGANEQGVPSATYLATHGNGLNTTIKPAGTKPPATTTAKPITATVTKIPSATADDTGQITVGGGPADKAYTITVTTKDKLSGGDDVQNVAIAKGDTAVQAAGKIDAAISDPNVTHAVAGAVVTVTPKKGSTVEKLTVIVS